MKTINIELLANVFRQELLKVVDGHMMRIVNEGGRVLGAKAYPVAGIFAEDPKLKHDIMYVQDGKEYTDTIMCVWAVESDKIIIEVHQKTNEEGASEGDKEPGAGEELSAESQGGD